MLNLNEKIFFIINNLAGHYHSLDGFFLFVTNFFVPAVIALSFFWFFIFLPRRSNNLGFRLTAYKNAFFLILSLGVVFVFVKILKGFVAFPRPQEILNGVHVLSIRRGFDSFPSLHSALAFAVASFTYHYHKPSGGMLFFLAILVAISRIFVGVHFPLDVLVGSIIGILVPSALVYLMRRYEL